MSQRHTRFEESTKLDPNSIFIPELPLNLRNDCKSGAWCMGGVNYGARLELIALKFNRRIAGQHISFIAPGTLLGELWFVAVGGGIGVDGDGREAVLPQNSIYYTLLKNSRQHQTKKDTGTGPLVNFGQQAMLLAASGYDYREVVWRPIFKKKEGKTATGDPLSYYTLDWQYTLPEDQSEKMFNRVGDCIKILDGALVQKLFDPELETTTISIDGMPHDELQILLASLRPEQAAIAQASLEK